MRKIELMNVELREYCILDLDSGQKVFSKESLFEGFTGIYFRLGEELFFGLYPTLNGPMAYYEGQSYPIHPGLTVSLEEVGDRRRRFRLFEYSLDIEYRKSPYVGLSPWDQEEDVDIFYDIVKNYQEKKFYKFYTRETTFLR